MSILSCSSSSWSKSTRRNTGTGNVLSLSSISSKFTYFFFCKYRQLVIQDFFFGFAGLIFYKTMKSITSDPMVFRSKVHSLKGRFKTLTLKDFLMISGVISFHASRTHFTTVRRIVGLEIGNSKKKFNHQSWLPKVSQN